MLSSVVARVVTVMGSWMSKYARKRSRERKHPKTSQQKDMDVFRLSLSQGGVLTVRFQATLKLSAYFQAFWEKDKLRKK